MVVIFRSKKKLWWPVLIPLFLSLVWLVGIKFQLVWLSSVAWLLFSLNLSWLLKPWLELQLEGFVIWSGAIAWLLGFYLVATWQAFFIVVYTTSLGLRWLSLVFSLLIAVWLFSQALPQWRWSDLEVANDGLWNLPKWLLPAWFLLLLVGLVWLQRSASGQLVTSWWQLMPSGWLLIWLFSSCLVWGVVFSRWSVQLVLLVLIGHSLLTHAPANTLLAEGYGLDKWRHFGHERQLQKSEVLAPALIGGDLEWRQWGPLAIPGVFVVGNKTSYAVLWGVVIFLAETFGLTLEVVDRWLVLGLWSFFMPLLSFYLGWFLFKKRRLALMTAAILNLFFALNYYGSFTVPLSLDVPFFLVGVLLWLQVWKQPFSKRWLVPIVFTALAYWHYILFFLLLVLLGLLLMFEQLGSRSARRRFWRWLVYLPAALFLPGLSWLFGYNQWSGWSGAVLNLKAFLGVVSGLRAWLIPSEFVFQVPWLYLDLGPGWLNLGLLSHDYWPNLISLSVLGFSFWSYFRFKKSRPWLAGSLFRFVLGYGLVLVVSWVVSWTFFSGDHILAIRLDPVISLIWGLLLAWGLFYLTINWGRPAYLKWGLLLVSLIFVSVSTFASGPSLVSASSDQVEVAHYITALEAGNPQCALSTGYALLPLEGVSSLVAGGFPEQVGYRQPERLRLWQAMISDPQKVWLAEAKLITGAENCYYFAEKRFLNSAVLEQTILVFGEPQIFGQIYLWVF